MGCNYFRWGWFQDINWLENKLRVQTGVFSFLKVVDSLQWPFIFILASFFQSAFQLFRLRLRPLVSSPLLRSQGTVAAFRYVTSFAQYCMKKWRECFKICSFRNRNFLKKYLKELDPGSVNLHVWWLIPYYIASLKTKLKTWRIFM